MTGHEITYPGTIPGRRGGEIVLVERVLCVVCLVGFEDVSRAVCEEWAEQHDKSQAVAA